MKSLSLEKLNFNISSVISKRSSFNSKGSPNISNSKKDNFKNFKIRSNKILQEKYQTNEDSLNVKLINDIIYNEKAHIVAQFKDHLIFDDANEFLRRYYKYQEIKKKLPTIYEFYDSYSKIFANYIILPESKYMYKNIQRKQKMIDNIQKFQSDKEKNALEKDDKIFNTEIYNSIMNQTTQYEDQNMTKTINSRNSRNLNNSAESIELLIDSICKAEKVGRRSVDKLDKQEKLLEGNFNTLTSLMSDANAYYRKTTENNIEKVNRETTKVLSPSPSISISTNSLIDNINNFNKGKQTNYKTIDNVEEGNLKNVKKQFKIKIEERASNENMNNMKNNPRDAFKSKTKTNSIVNTVGDKEKEKGALTTRRGENTDRIEKIEKNDKNDPISKTEKIGKIDKNKLFNIYSNPKILAPKESYNNSNNLLNTINASTGSSKMIKSKPIIINNKPESETEYYKINKLSPLYSHKATYSMPKLPISNINAANNANNTNNNANPEKTSTYQSSLAGSIDKNLLKSLSINCDSNSISNGFNSHATKLVTTSNNLKEDKPSSKAQDLHINSRENSKIKETKYDYNKYLISSLSDTSRLKHKVLVNLVNETNNNNRLSNKNSLANCDTSGINSKFLNQNQNQYTSILNSNGNTMSYSNTINVNNISYSKIKSNNEKVIKQDILTNSLTNRYLENNNNKETSSIGALLHRDLFVAESKREKTKNIVVNNTSATKVHTRPESKFRDNLLSRNSLEKLTIDHNKDKQIQKNTFNIKKEAKSSMTDRIVSSNLAKTTIYSPKTGSVINANGNAKQNFSKINSQYNSISNNNKYVINQKTKSDTISTITNDFAVRKKETDNNFNRNSESQNNVKSLRGNKKIITRGIKSITTFPFSNSDVNVGHLSSTPIKQTLETNHKNTKSNVFIGEGLTNLNHICSKESNIVRKVQDSKINGTKMSNGNTPNDVTKKITKIKNFYEVVKNANLHLNSNSERVSGSLSSSTNIYNNNNSNSKPELFMNQNKILKNKFK